ncbi:DNA gyrase inhibitor YacG [Hydrogenophaga sp. 5NK40-0174]|uniref:DNA gyrase inhibitor YacG n=1 Tax=Hydrogenophaga sp. 5NK40-0174 TaxID=3127649 RepID=UPI00333FD75F
MSTPAPRTVQCPQCGGPSRYAPDNPARPFCSPRCKGLDLGAWASEEYAVAEQQSSSDPRFEES